MYAAAATGFRPYRVRRQRSPWPSRLARLAVLLIAVLTLLIALARVALGGAAGPTEAVQVRAGDTVWGIAANRYPGNDVRARVYQIDQLNHLSGGKLRAGQTLYVPTS